jgi:hypothetical protein
MGVGPVGMLEGSTQVRRDEQMPRAGTIGTRRELVNRSEFSRQRLLQPDGDLNEDVRSCCISRWSSVRSRDDLTICL